MEHDGRRGAGIRAWEQRAWRRRAGKGSAAWRHEGAGVRRRRAARAGVRRRGCASAVAQEKLEHGGAVKSVGQARDARQW